MAEVLLSQNQVAVIDDDQVLKVGRFKWFAQWYKNTQSFYAGRGVKDSNGKTSMSLMHREILGLMPGDKRIVDHINGNTLDNRRSNLRIVSTYQSAQNRRTYKNNTSGHKGVQPYRDCWRVVIQANGKRYSLGVFSTFESACSAYQAEAAKAHGAYARAREVKYV